MKLHSRSLWLFVLLIHLAGAAAWAWMMPGGFPPSHHRFWSNRALPGGIVLLVLLGLWWGRRDEPARLRLVLAGFAALWLGAGGTGAVLFPISVGWRGVFVLLWSGVVLLAYRSVNAAGPARKKVVAVTAAGLIIGAYCPWTQRAAPPQTLPLGGETVVVTAATEFPPRLIRLSQEVSLQADQALLTMQHGRYALWVEPLLTFSSRSPDRCWTSLAPRSHRAGPPRRLRAVELTEGNVLADYTDDGRSTLSAGVDGSELQLTAATHLPQPVFSHLNSLLQVSIAGHRRLSLAFSPCPQERIEVLPMDYPVGRPARLAHLGADGVFRVVEASSGEKGPYRQLAGGTLERGTPLVVILYDQETEFARLTLHDWSAQVSTALSPTAGYGLPQNAIEFALGDDAPAAPATLFVSLAATSVGRGWDSVGHAAGTYRNRMTIQWPDAVERAQYEHRADFE